MINLFHIHPNIPGNELANFNQRIKYDQKIGLNYNRKNSKMKLFASILREDVEAIKDVEVI